MISIDGIVVVEGRDDKTALLRVIDANIFVLNGMTGANMKKIDDLKKLAEDNKIYLLLDPDASGNLIRNKINKNISGVINLYASRSKATKNGNVGIENMSNEDLLEIFSKIRAEEKKEDKFNAIDMIELGLNNRLNREILGDYLGISYSNSKQFLKKLNALNISKEEVIKGINFVEMFKETKDKKAAIFGKFFPAHKGHINFIKKVSRYCKKLYVFVCEETTRDKKLFEESKMPCFITIKDRVDIIKKEIKGYKNIEVLSLNEDGIESYPNGWENWSNRVLEQGIYFDIVFTNEIQDVSNYSKYMNKKAYMIDQNRDEFNISSTKIRNNPEKYMEYIPDSVKEIFWK